jgi:hypothetical protein
VAPDPGGAEFRSGEHCHNDERLRRQKVSRLGHIFLPLTQR